MKYIIKKSIVDVPQSVGSIVDTFNIENQTTNAPSLNLCRQMMGVPVNGVIDYDGTEVPEGYEQVDVSDTAMSEIQTIANMLFPIGRGFLDFTDTDYSNWLGLTWERELMGMTPIGYSSSDSDFSTIGSTGGEKTHTLTTSEMPNHNHSGIRVTKRDGTNVNYIGLMGGDLGSIAASQNNAFVMGYSYTGSEGSFSSSNSWTLTSGGGTAHNNLPPYQVVSYWKRTA